MEKHDNAEKQFFKMLYVIANLTPNFELDEPTVEIYDRALSELGYEQLCHSLLLIMNERRMNDPFPSIRLIKETVEPTVDPKALAIESASRIITAVKKFGYTNSLEAKEYVGSLGWAVVERNGGWYNVCSTMRVDQEPILRSQFERLALGLQQRVKAGQNIDEAPQLDYNSDSKLTALAQNLAEQKQLGQKPTEEE